MNQQARYEKQLSDVKESLRQQTEANVSLRSELAKREAILIELETAIKTVRMIY